MPILYHKQEKIVDPVMPLTITPEMVKNAYEVGYFPMAESYNGRIYWHSPDPRAIFPLGRLKPPKSLSKKLRHGEFQFTVNEEFHQVIVSCSLREDTWINDSIIDIYAELHDEGIAHSVETWHDGQLVGGLYGIALGGAFFGESMFNTISDAAKAAFYFLVQRLRERNFILLDSQYLNPFTAQLGAIEINRNKYMKILHKAINLPISFQ